MEKNIEKKPLELDALSIGSYQPAAPTRLKHNVVGIINIVVATLLFALTLVFNGLMGKKDGPFHNNIGNLSDYYYFEVTPAGWAFSIWGLIYLMQMGFVVYAIASIFRTTSKGPLYVYPPVIPGAAYIIYSINLASTIAWLFAFDRMHLVLSAVLLVANPLTLIAMMVLSLSKLDKIKAFFKSEGQKKEIVLLNIFVYNAWAIYLGWTVCAALLNVGMNLIYVVGLGQQCTGLIVLSTLMVLILVVFPLEITILDKYLRFVIMHWFGPIVAMVGSVVKGGANDKGIKPSGVNRLYAAIILGALIICYMVKVLNMVRRLWKKRCVKKTLTINA